MQHIAFSVSFLQSKYRFTVCIKVDRPYKREYIGGMKIKTSITLSQELLETIEHLPEHYGNRSLFLETAAWAYIRQLQRAEQAAYDLEILNRRADYLNEEVADALSYQVAL
jgi:hypothetical protein